MSEKPSTTYPTLLTWPMRLGLFRSALFHARSFVVLGALALLAGCAHKSVAPQAKSTPQPETAPVAAPVQSATIADAYRQAAAVPCSPYEGIGWQSMFDGQTLTGWRETQFAGRGEVSCRAGLLVLDMGDPFTGVNWTNEFPTMNYEVALDAMRVMGSDFFCGLTVPVGTNFCSLIVGGWGGSLVGISSLDDMDASENETTKYLTFEQKHWYRIRLRVTPHRLEGWIDREKVADVVTTGRQISLRPGDIELSAPFGIAAWTTTAALREIRWRSVDGPADPPKPRRD